jgi:hypothetical protein
MIPPLSPSDLAEAMDDPEALGTPMQRPADLLVGMPPVSGTNPMRRRAFAPAPHPLRSAVRDYRGLALMALFFALVVMS